VLERFALVELELVVLAPDREPEQVLDEVWLGLEHRADGRLGDPGGVGDVGDIQFLPYDDQSFDVVAGFHSIPFAAQPLEALREARRVAKPGAPVFLVVFGREEHNDLASVLHAIRAPLPAMPAAASGPLALSAPGVLAALLGRARLAVQEETSSIRHTSTPT
jgi:SAM-dependent methyltransferase